MIDVSKLKNRWLGEWDFQYAYKKNDIVQWKNSSYVCIRDIPMEYASSMENNISTANYYAFAPGIYIKTFDPSDTRFWLLFSPGTGWKGPWRPFLRYERGDVVSLAGDLYICIANTATQYTGATATPARNTYPTDTNYWTQILQSADRDRRMFGVQTFNQQPLGWTRNLGGKWCNGENGGATGIFGYIDVEGNCNFGGFKKTGCGSGDADGAGSYTAFTWQQTGFLFSGWLNSTQNGATERLTTPDGEAPKVTQWIWNANQLSYWLLNNGEVYSAGLGAQGQIGNSSTTTRYYPIRVYATDTTDYLGNTIPYTFSNSKIVKVVSSVQGYNAATNTSQFALDDLGQVWAWGYNAYGQLGLGSDNTAAASSGNATTNQTRPRCIPRSFFEGRKIVDIYAWGGNLGGAFAVDEDGYLWAWGCELYGELGLGNRAGSGTASYAQHWIPQKVDIDWPRYGGIQKIWIQNMGASTRWTTILDGEGKLWIGGFVSDNVALTQFVSGSQGGSQYGTGAFVRLQHGWWRDHEVDNFWYIGDGNFSLYLRERGTGISYSCGHNYHGTLGQSSNITLWWNSGGFKPEPGRMDGPMRIVEVWNNHGSFSTSTSPNRAYMTACLLTEDGEIWATGSNDFGSMGISIAGVSSLDPVWSEMHTSPQQFRRIPHPGGYSAKFSSGCGWPLNTTTADAGAYLTDSGQMFVAGYDGADGSNYFQGHYYSARYYQINIIDSGAYHRYNLHGLPGG